MAEKRMFTKKITDSDSFIELSSSAQALYFHLNQSADDDGFNNQVQNAIFKAHATIDDLKVLMLKNFIIRFESGVIVIKHWRMHNTLRKDRYTPTNFKEEFEMLGIKDNGSYTLSKDDGCQMVAKWLPNGCHSIDKISKDKISIEENSIDIYSPAKEEPNIPFKEICEHLNKLTNSNYRSSSKKTQELIKARFNEGYTLDDFKIVIEKKCFEWMNTDMQKYLRPETLFGTKFEGYLNQQVHIKELTTKDLDFDITQVFKKG